MSDRGPYVWIPHPGSELQGLSGQRFFYRRRALSVHPFAMVSL